MEEWTGYEYQPRDNTATGSRGYRVKSPRLVVTLDEGARGDLEGLAGEDGVSLGEEVRRLARREVARRKNRERAMLRCAGCPRLG